MANIRDTFFPICGLQSWGGAGDMKLGKVERGKTQFFGVGEQKGGGGGGVGNQQKGGFLMFGHEVGATHPLAPVSGKNCLL